VNLEIERSKTMRRLLIVAVTLLVPLCLSAMAADTIAKIDKLHDQGNYEEARTLALEAASSAGQAEKAELYWRASRETLELGDEAEDRKESKDAILKYFEKGQEYADMAIAANPQNNLAYYWKSSNIGRWGQVKGILNSLFKAAPMKELLLKDLSLDPSHPDAYYVLGQLYRELPGAPLSFGNEEAAVSLGRMALDLRAKAVQAGTEKELNYSFYLQLAKSLWKRNLNDAKRASGLAKKQAAWQSAKTPLEKGSAYEATVQLAAGTDREEARQLVNWMIAELTKIASRTAGQDSDLADAKETLAEWK
jgi:tetratricopeptide (TPR) repeat protein